MHSQQEQKIVAPATDQDHVQSPGKAKGVLSKVKHKARKLKDKVKKVTHSGNNAHDVDKHGHVGDRDRAGLHPTLAHEGKDVSGDSTDDYDYDSEEQEDDLDDSQMKYERLSSVGASDKQGDGSDVELHDGVPASAAVKGSYWKSVDDDSPVSIYKSAGPPDSLQATPTEYHNYAAINDDQSLKGSDKAKEMKPPSGKRLDEANPSGPDHVFHGKIGVYSEDLSADRKLGIGIASDRYRDSDEDVSMSARDINKHVGHESPTLSPVDGAQQIYRPVAEPDSLKTPLPSESINASLYGDVLAAEDKLSKSIRTRDDYPSEQSEEEFSFDKQNLSNKRSEMVDPEPENDVAAAQDKASVEVGGEGQEASRSVEDWGKWSADKLNNAVDSLALKVAGGGTPEEHMVVGENDRSIDREASDVSYFDPNDVQDKTFQEQFALGSSGIANQEENALLDSAVAGSVAIVGKLTELKDSIASTLGIGGSETPADVPHVDSEEHPGNERSLNLNGGGMRESSKGEDDQQQTGFLQGLKETMGLAFGVGNASSQPEPMSEEKPHLAGTDSISGKSGGLSHEWSLDSASDVPQAAFL